METIQPKMSARDIIKIQMNALQNDYYNSGIKVAYNLASPANKESTGPFNLFAKMVRNPVYRFLLRNKSWKIMDSQKTSPNNFVAIVKVIGKDNSIHFYKFELSRQYDHVNQRPLYDPYSKIHLHNYWRTDSVMPVTYAENFYGGPPKVSHSSLKNIYGEPLVPCRKSDSNDPHGSWNKHGYCDETGGGVHQICLDVDRTRDFSKNTGQGPWSDERKGKNHCMCLGAWSLYKARQKENHIEPTDGELHCESIMDDAFDQKYVNNWNTWNGNELPNQVVDGVNSLMNQCYASGNHKQRQHLINLYKNLTSNKPEFQDTAEYIRYSNM